MASFHRVSLWCRRDAGGKPAAMLVNTSLYAAGKVEVRMLNAGGPAVLTPSAGRAQTLEGRGSDGPYTVFEIDRLELWTPILLSCAK